MIDCFGKGVLVTEAENGISNPLPEASRTELFNFVENELIAAVEIFHKQTLMVEPISMLLQCYYLNCI